MLEEFFLDIKTPKFLKNEFDKDDWYEVIGKLRDLLDENIKESVILSPVKKVSINGKVYIGKNCKIAEYVVIDGPCFIDDDVEIGPGVYIRPGSVISKYCSVGHASEIKNSIMMEHSKVANHVLLTDSIIGVSARLGGHCETTNRNFDQSNIYWNFEKEKINSNLDKLGVILGEQSRLGGGVFTLPGTTIGRNTFVSTMTVVSGFIPKESFVKYKITNTILKNKKIIKLKDTKLLER